MELSTNRALYRELNEGMAAMLHAIRALKDTNRCPNIAHHPRYALRSDTVSCATNFSDIELPGTSTSAQEDH